MARTLPPTRNTTGTTELAFADVSPIDAYAELIDRPLAYFESTIESSVSTATASIPTVYVHATITAGMSGNLSATAAHFQTHIAGTSVGKLTGVASWIQVDDDFTANALAPATDFSVSITPLNTGVRCSSGTVTFTNAQVVFGIYSQYLAGAGTVDPTILAWARIHSTVAVDAILYFENAQSAGWTAAGTHTAEVGQIALAWVNGAPSSGQTCYVKIYRGT